jgi:hypothetical protein
MAGMLALALVAAQPVSAVRPVAQIVEHYAIEVPAGYALKDVSPKLIDFELFALVDKRTRSTKCTLYIGNFPSFPMFRWAGSPIESKGSDRTRREFRSAHRVDGLMSFRGVTYQDSAESPFTSIHYFADHLSRAEIKIVTAMVDSIRVAKKDIR